MKTLLIVLFALAAKTDTGYRIAQDSNRAPDVVAPKPYIIAPSAAEQHATPSPGADEAAKANSDRSSAEAKMIRSLNTQIVRGQLGLAQANGQIDALKGQLDKTRTELDDLWEERVALEDDLAAAKETAKAASADAKRLGEDNAKSAKKLDAATARSRELIFQRLILLGLVPLGFHMYFRLRRQNASILARLPSEEKEEMIRRLDKQVEEMRREQIEDADRLKAEMHTLRLDRDAARKNADENAANAAELERQLTEKTGLANAQNEDIQRLAKLQQGSEATIIKLQDELADANTIIALSKGLGLIKKLGAQRADAAPDPAPALPESDSVPVRIDDDRDATQKVHTGEVSKPADGQEPPILLPVFEPPKGE